MTAGGWPFGPPPPSSRFSARERALKLLRAAAAALRSP